MSHFVSTISAGDVDGPDSATDGRIVLMNGTSGKLIKQGDVLGADLVTGPASVADEYLVKFSGLTGKLIAATDILPNEVQLSENVQTVAATEAQSVQANDLTNVLILNPAAPRTDVTVLFPEAPDPGQRFTIAGTTSAITNLTCTPGTGTTIVAGLTTLAVGDFATWKLNGTVWVRVG